MAAAAPPMPPSGVVVAESGAPPSGLIEVPLLDPLLELEEPAPDELPELEPDEADPLELDELDEGDPPPSSADGFEPEDAQAIAKAGAPRRARPSDRLRTKTACANVMWRTWCHKGQGPSGPVPGSRSDGRLDRRREGAVPTCPLAKSTGAMPVVADDVPSGCAMVSLWFAREDA
jgi:hypothetical protein